MLRAQMLLNSSGMNRYEIHGPLTHPHTLPSSHNQVPLALRLSKIQREL